MFKNSVIFGICMSANLLLVMQSFASCPKDDDQTANSPVSDSNLQGISSSLQAAQNLPDDPSSQPKMVKQPWWRISVNVNGETGASKVSVVDFIALDNAAISDSTNPGHAQAVADIASALNLYMLATGQTTICTGSSGAKVSASAAGSTGTALQPILPAPIHTQSNCTSAGPQTFSQYITLMQQNAGSLTSGAKLELFSMLGGKLGDLYNYGALNSITPLPTVFQALITNAANAGVCRDIHTFLAVTGQALGIADASVTTTDWNNGIETGGHVIFQGKDPQTGKYFIVNYNNVTLTNASNQAEAAQDAAMALNSNTSLVQTQAITAAGGGNIHDMRTPRDQAIQGAITQGANMDGPNLSISVGVLGDTVSAQKKLIGDNDDRVGVFAVATDSREGNPFVAGTTGVAGNVGFQSATSANTRVEVRGTGIVGVMDVLDQPPGGGTRSDTTAYVNLDANTDFSWNKGGNTGKVGAQVQEQVGRYVHNWSDGSEIAYTTVDAYAIDNPTKNIQIHFKDTNFLTTTTAQNVNMELHHEGDAAGVKVTHQFDGGKITVTNDSTGHAFAGGAYGVNDAAQVSVNTAKKGTFTVGADCGHVFNTGTDPFYNYPSTCEAQGDYEKKVGKVTLGANVSATTGHNAFPLMQDDDPQFTQPGTTVTPAKVEGGFHINF